MGRKSNKNKQIIQQKVAENSKKITPKIEEKVVENSKKPTLKLDEKVLENSNLEGLRRIGRFIAECVMKVNQVELYEYDEDKKDWIQKGVRGELYLVKRTNEPRYQVIVFNGQDQGKFVENMEDMETKDNAPSLCYRSRASNKDYWIRFYSSPEFCATPTYIPGNINFYAFSLHKWSSSLGNQPKDQTTRSESEHEKGGAQSSSMAEVLQEPLVRGSSFWKFLEGVVKIGKDFSQFRVPVHNSSSSTSTTVAASPSGILSPSRLVILDSSAPTEKDDNSNGGSRKSISVDNVSLLVPPSTTTSSSLVRANTLSQRQRPIISKDLIRSALQNLIQEDAFISMFSDALEKARRLGDDDSCQA